MLTHKEERWALVFTPVGNKSDRKFIGHYEPTLRTYKTREEAREIKEVMELNTLYHRLKVVKVSVTVKEISSRKEST